MAPRNVNPTVGLVMNAIVLGGASMLLAAFCLKFVDEKAAEGVEAD